MPQGWPPTNMVTAFDIAGLFKQQWGYNPPGNYAVNLVNNGINDLRGKSGNYVVEKRNENPQQLNSSEFWDINNAPVEQITGKLGGDFWAKDNYQREYFMPVVLNGVSLWFPVISVIELNRQVVETDMVERSGSVKEIISTDDLVINIKGLIVGVNNQWPEDEFTQLCSLFAINRSVEIKSVITNIAFNKAFGQMEQDKHMVVIKRVPITPKVGVKHVIPYELNLVSDTIFELELA